MLHALAADALARCDHVLVDALPRQDRQRGTDGQSLMQEYLHRGEVLRDVLS
jgi:hypothetical protein